MTCDRSRDAASPVPPEEPDGQVARSGAGADTALQAMLKKRGMRARRDAEPSPPSPVDSEDSQER